MSRGPGRVERAIEAAFLDCPTSTFTTEELAVLAYPGVNRIEKKHRVAVLRAAEKVCRRLHWLGQPQCRPAGTTVYSNLLDVRSYTLGKLQRDFITGSRSRSDLERLVDDPSAGWRDWDWTQPGGPYWRHVEIHRAQAAGDDARAAELREVLERSVAERMNKLRPLR